MYLNNDIIKAVDAVKIMYPVHSIISAMSSCLSVIFACYKIYIRILNKVYKRRSHNLDRSFIQILFWYLLLFFLTWD